MCTEGRSCVFHLTPNLSIDKPQNHYLLEQSAAARRAEPVQLSRFRTSPLQQCPRTLRMVLSLQSLFATITDPLVGPRHALRQQVLQDGGQVLIVFAGRSMKFGEEIALNLPDIWIVDYVLGSRAWHLRIGVQGQKMSHTIVGHCSLFSEITLFRRKSE
jgi:hypothetical protein